MAAAPRVHERLVFIDNLRWSAITMVVVLHAAVTYSGVGSWYYVDRLTTDRPTIIGLATYQSLQHAVAMGLLFGIAGYFAGAAMERKGARAFLVERSFRLGLPLLLYVLVIGPLTEYYIARTWHSRPPRSFLDEWLLHVADGTIARGSGPLWFCFVLLVFSLCFAAIHPFVPRRDPSVRPPPGPGRLAGFALAMTALTFAVGAAMPRAGTVLNVVVHDLPQYPLMFAAGVLAQRRDWLLRFPRSYGLPLVVVGVVISLCWWFAMLTLGGAFRGELATFGGGWHWQAAAMDLWRSCTCIALGVGLVTLYRDHGNRQGPLARFLTGSAFGVYLFHPPILIALTVGLRDLPAHALLKFAIAAVLATVLTFASVGLIARRVPVLKSIL